MHVNQKSICHTYCEALTADSVPVKIVMKKGNLMKQPIKTIRFSLKGRCPEVTHALIILAAAHEGMQAKQIYFKHLYYSTLHSWHWQQEMKPRSRLSTWTHSGKDGTTLPTILTPMNYPCLYSCCHMSH